MDVGSTNFTIKWIIKLLFRTLLMNASKISPPSALASTIGGVMYMHSFAEGETLLCLVNNF